MIPEPKSPSDKAAQTTRHSGMDKILRLGRVLEASGLSRATVYEMMGRGDFPLPVRIGKRSVGWRQSEITHWLFSRPIAKRPQSQLCPSRKLLTGDPRFDEITKEQFQNWIWNDEDIEE